jgi:hypothetical protein
MIFFGVPSIARGLFMSNEKNSFNRAIKQRRGEKFRTEFDYQ